MLHLWNPLTATGSIGDQSTGYLVPMGPFCSPTLWGSPAAISQRLWLGLLLVIGFWGLVRLADALGMGNRAGRILGGLAYVLSPFVMARIGDNSALLLGDIMLPWVLLPLVRVTYPRGRTSPESSDPASDSVAGSSRRGPSHRGGRRHFPAWLSCSPAASMQPSLWTC